MSTEETVKEILERLLCVDEQELTPQALLVEDLGMDSLDRVEISMELEEALLEGEEIDEEIAENWKTVADVLLSVEAMVDRATHRAGRV